MEVTDEVSRTSEMRNGVAIVGPAAAPISESIKCRRGIIVSADPTNTATIFISSNPNVTADRSLAQGYPVYANCLPLVIPADDPGELYAVSDDSEQRLYWMAV